jgi:SAM-dependent methyltransferase
MPEKNDWERERRIHFDEIVLNYDRVRWNYPDELYNDIFKYTKNDKCKEAIEIGAGTGKATTPFINAGYNVTAIELGKNMVEFLGNKFCGVNKFNIINTAFEDVSLDKDNFDLIYAASSFHWVDSEIGCPKAFSLLKNGGVFALFRNNFSPEDHELYSEFQEVYRNKRNNFKTRRIL